MPRGSNDQARTNKADHRGKEKTVQTESWSFQLFTSTYFNILECLRLMWNIDKTL